MQDFRQRTALLLGEQQILRIENTLVAVLGLGGVGGAAVEALARLGVGNILVADSDKVELSNLNRQILATHSSLGGNKTDAAAARILDINPQAKVTAAQQFYMPENRDFLFDYAPDVVIDAIDTVTAKLDLAEQCHKRGVPLVMCLGMGNRFDPSAVRLGDISDTANGSGCGLARVIRRELKKRGVIKQQVVYSLEAPTVTVAPDSRQGRHSPGSAPFVPPAAGYLLAYAAMRIITAEKV